jgi:acetyl-CoA carboxylase carboxyl transferase beta subunit/acetyl-CoA carboxylase carboxyl transferase alpha subunit
MTQKLNAAPAEDTGWLACRRCRALVYEKRFIRELRVCTDCGDHAPLTAPQRLDQLLDEGSAETLPQPGTPEDPLEFVDVSPYRDRLDEARDRTGLEDAVICARGTIDGRPLVIAAMDFRFMGGSLGTAVGEQIVRAADVALDDRIPLIMVTASGGARMQEGILSLMQMAKTSEALAQLDKAGILTISIITDPTYAGVAASFATLADVIVAEPGARMGFTGPRVIEQTIGESLPEGFQTAEFLLEHGLIDDVQPRKELRSTIGHLLAAGRPAEPGPAQPGPAEPDATLIRRPEQVPEQESWDAVQAARNVDRPTTLEYVAHLLEGFVELHGDRMSGDSRALVGGLGRLDGRPVMLLGHQKGHNTGELVSRDFGMPTPDGYRKAGRLMRLAAKLGVPVLTFIDTPGAHPGIEAEEQGQAIAIAENLRLMATLPVPVVTVVTGEGGSGGALALGVADRVLCFASSTYSVISPEGCAAILWRDRAMAADAAAALRVDAREQLRLGVVDAVIPEPEGGAHSDPLRAADLLRGALKTMLAELTRLPVDELLDQRRRRFREFGTTTTGEGDGD